MTLTQLQELLKHLPPDADGIIVGGEGNRLSFSTQTPGKVDLNIFHTTPNVYNGAHFDRPEMKGFRFRQNAVEPRSRKGP
jgi:hypothetical protein